MKGEGTGVGDMWPPFRGREEYLNVLKLLLVGPQEKRIKQTTFNFVKFLFKRKSNTIGQLEHLKLSTFLESVLAVKARIEWNVRLLLLLFTANLKNKRIF